MIIYPPPILPVQGTPLNHGEIIYHISVQFRKGDGQRAGLVSLLQSTKPDPVVLFPPANFAHRLDNIRPEVRSAD